ncbi:hypothetical protein FA13DRAFT_1799232 [Coprinellus micaceus]|uniref:Uncharacterized protein n=1 Tax=Coprinellus micaceus TaxID=71717 RepID=A0A4Y7SLI5_COPMI|nr:hypothetical protein FA13DRAFT_1799232 [Coprinellus micaceus]
MSHILLGDHPSTTRFFLLGCFLEQRQRAFLVEMKAHASQLSDSAELVDLFLSEMRIAIEVLGYQRCLEPEMPCLPSLHRIGLVIFRGRAEVWDLLRHGSLLPPGHDRDPSMLTSSRNGPEFKIRSWWSTPRSLSTPKKLLEEFNWAMNSLLSRIPGEITGEDAEKLADEMRIVCEGMKSQTDRLRRLEERYDRLIVDARARLAAFDRISQGASDL